MPVIPDIRTSRIRHAVSSTYLELPNTSADGKATTLNPNERRRRIVESRIRESSSTTHISGFPTTLSFPLILGPVPNVFRPKTAPSEAPELYFPYANSPFLH